MLFKMHAHFVFYGDLADYQDRMAKIEQKLVEKARDFRLDSTKIYLINDIFQ